MSSADEMDLKKEEALPCRSTMPAPVPCALPALTLARLASFLLQHGLLSGTGHRRHPGATVVSLAAVGLLHFERVMMAL